MVTEIHTKEEILALLQEIKDPEIPVLSIQDIGMLRDIHITNNGYEVILTPTYTGCPAMGIIEADIKALLETKGISPVKVSLTYSPAWTTDWMTEEAKLKMQRYGIAPPKHSSCGDLATAEMHVACPYCGSKHTELISRFGSTACKSLYKCEDCKEPFEYFKCH
ncbi:MAG: phenylacetate-CoA oxygenase subunit PaaJ [Bacteroidetes bacterium]|nr:phenylacetate-CoA oxygenase subunit PaaJ [Bacteroidota bacterium]